MKPTIPRTDPKNERCLQKQKPNWDKFAAEFSRLDLETRLDTARQQLADAKERQEQFAAELAVIRRAYGDEAETHVLWDSTVQARDKAAADREAAEQEIAKLLEQIGKASRNGQKK